MTDATLALMGVSAGIGSMAGAWVALTWRNRHPTRTEKLTRRIYRHLDEIIGATKAEDQIRADRRWVMIFKRRWYWWLVPKSVRVQIADFMNPTPPQAAGGVRPLPSDRRIRHYVQMGDHPGDWWVRYTSEAPANREVFLDYLERGRPTQGGGMAQALGREWHAGMFQVTWDRSQDLVRLTLRTAAQEQVPTRPPMDVRSST
jgi:hypothetical protein